MKKIFTLIAMAVMAIGANAQDVEVWDASSIKDQSSWNTTSPRYNIVQADKITMEDNTSENAIIHAESDVLPWSGYANENGDKITDPKVWSSMSDSEKKNYSIQLTPDLSALANNSEKRQQNVKIEGSTKNVKMKFMMTPNIGDESGAFSYGLGYNPDEPGNQALNTDLFSTKFIDRIKPKSGNATLKHYEWWEYNTDGDPTHRYYDVPWTLEEKTVPAVSANITLTAQCDGKINVGIYQNGNHLQQPVYVLDVNEDETYTALAPSELYYKGYLNNNTVEPIVDGHPGDDYIIAPDDSNGKGFLGYLSFDMKEGKKYMIFLVQQQIHLYGFEFTPAGETGISEIATSANDVNAPAYNLAGQKVGNDYKGIVIKNGKKLVNK